MLVAVIFDMTSDTKGSWDEEVITENTAIARTEIEFGADKFREVMFSGSENTRRFNEDAL